MRGAALLTAVVAPLFAAVQPGQATKSTGHEAKRCGVLAKGSADYRIKARKLSCRFARKWSRAYLNSRSGAPGFDCYRAGTNVTFYCANGAKAYWAERLTATAASHPDRMKGTIRVVVLPGLGDTKPPLLTRETAPACRCAASQRAATACA
jgi:hypothetical protein